MHKSSDLVILFILGTSWSGDSRELQISSILTRTTDQICLCHKHGDLSNNKYAFLGKIFLKWVKILIQGRQIQSSFYNKHGDLSNNSNSTRQAADKFKVVFTKEVSSK